MSASFFYEPIVVIGGSLLAVAVVAVHDLVLVPWWKRRQRASIEVDASSGDFRGIDTLGGQ
jgi:hypothetical protein